MCLLTFRASLKTLPLTTSSSILLPMNSVSPHPQAPRLRGVTTPFSSRLPLGHISLLNFAPEELPVYRIVSKLENWLQRSHLTHIMTNTFSQIYLQFVFSVEQIVLEAPMEPNKLFKDLTVDRKLLWSK